MSRQAPRSLRAAWRCSRRRCSGSVRPTPGTHARAGRGSRASIASWIGRMRSGAPSMGTSRHGAPRRCRRCRSASVATSRSTRSRLAGSRKRSGRRCATRALAAVVGRYRQSRQWRRSFSAKAPRHQSFPPRHLWTASRTRSTAVAPADVMAPLANSPMLSCVTTASPWSRTCLTWPTRDGAIPGLGQRRSGQRSQVGRSCRATARSHSCRPLSSAAPWSWRSTEELGSITNLASSTIAPRTPPWGTQCWRRASGRTSAKSIGSSRTLGAKVGAKPDTFACCGMGETLTTLCAASTASHRKASAATAAPRR
mmetsp:Transcript_106862/g.300443  ORF Transcript_106862/g.300443 Transcript_106862/m.300443 type:complete len:311 (-) Transcript_106862:181-1113(-)